MRKTAIVGLCFCLLLALLSGCGKKTVQPEPESSAPMRIEGTFRIRCDGFSFSAAVNAAPGSAEITFSEPENIAGYVIRCNDSEFVFDMCGVTSVRNAQDAPGSSVAGMLYPVLRSALSGTGKFRNNGAGREYETSGAVVSLDEAGNVCGFADRNGKVQAERI